MPAGQYGGSSPVTNEFGLIRRLKAQVAMPDRLVFQGIGDDCAVLKTSPTEWTLITTDLMTEGIHFDTALSSWEDIGYRGAIANLSDIAAMGGTPRFMVVSLAVPPSCSAVAIERLYKGLMQAARPSGVSLVGGDTSASRRGLFFSITLTGVVKPGRVLMRKGARVGDQLYVTGTLGDSHAGLHLLTKRRRTGRSILSPAQAQWLVARHHRPSARLAEGQWLVEQGFASAAIDLSDGLSGDLRHICEESQVGADVAAASLPISRACRTFALMRHMDPTQIALQGGEDYELLFTVPPGKQSRFERLAAKTNFSFTCIGSITPKRSGLRMHTEDRRIVALPNTSYEHFVSPPS